MTYASGRQVAANRLARRVVKHLTRKQRHREGETSDQKTDQNNRKKNRNRQDTQSKSDLKYRHKRNTPFQTFMQTRSSGSCNLHGVMNRARGEAGIASPPSQDINI